MTGPRESPVVCIHCGGNHWGYLCPTQMFKGTLPPDPTRPPRVKGKSGFAMNAFGAVLLIGGIAALTGNLPTSNVRVGNNGQGPAQVYPVHSFTLYRKRGEYQMFAATGQSSDRTYKSLSDCHRANNPDVHCTVITSVPVKAAAQQCWAADLRDEMPYDIIVGLGETKDAATADLQQKCATVRDGQCLRQIKTGCARLTPSGT